MAVYAPYITMTFEQLENDIKTKPSLIKMDMISKAIIHWKSHLHWGSNKMDPLYFQIISTSTTTFQRVLLLLLLPPFYDTLDFVRDNLGEPVPQ